MNETSSFIKKMASPDAKIRDRAVRTVRIFMSNKGDSLSYDEFMKLWKGFFYCFWLSDTTDGQFALAELISKLVHNLPPIDKDGGFGESGAALFLRSFWETMGREWPLLDRLRLNKYYNLMKQVLSESFKMIAIASESENDSAWDPEIVKGHTDILLSTVFDYTNGAYPESIRSYVIENYFESLKASAAEPFSAEMTLLVCEPIIHAVAYCENKAFFKQSSEALIQGLLPGGDEEDSEEMSESESVEAEESEESDSEEVDENAESVDEESIDEESIDEESIDEESIDDESDAENSENDDFDSEEFDMIKSEDAHCCDGAEHDHSADDYDDDEEEDEPFVFDYSLLAKFIFDFGARDDVLIRNRRFLYDLSQIIEQVATGSFESCCDAAACDDETCCN